MDIEGEYYGIFWYETMNENILETRHQLITL